MSSVSRSDDLMEVGTKSIGEDFIFVADSDGKQNISWRKDMV